MQHLEQLFRICLHRQYISTFEKLRKRPLHDLAILNHVRDARWATQVVLQYVNLPVSRANQIGSGDVAPNPSWRLHPLYLFQKAFARLDHVLRQDSIANDLLVVIDVVDKHVQRTNPLLQTPFDVEPFLLLNHARNEIKRPYFFRSCGVTIDIESDSHVEKLVVSRTLPTLKFAGWQGH